MELTWFRRPSADQPGTLNACYNAVDRHVVSGLADHPAITGSSTLDFAALLEQVAALAGALQALGVEQGHLVRVLLDDPVERVLAWLACERLGAVHGDVSSASIVIASSDLDEPGVRARILSGVPGSDPGRDVDWLLAIKAGREQPAGCTPVAPDAAAYVVAGEVVLLQELGSHPSEVGELHARLYDGLPLTLP
ncbi:hypothetical protein NOCA2680013 [metagenome]|uniref:AMP-dependent synthetase/ligase domain-containing protein n=1 Tax=metagenome TaxID=256318 RepID=A0A2P2CCP8_9ZZZZ